jgi:hypothetical protein
MVLSALAAGLCHLTDETNNRIPVAVLILLIAALIENLTEPFHVYNVIYGRSSQNKQAELLSSFAQTLTTYFLIRFFDWGVVAFAVGQFTYSIVLALLHFHILGQNTSANYHEVYDVIPIPSPKSSAHINVHHPTIWKLLYWSTSDYHEYCLGKDDGVMFIDIEHHKLLREFMRGAGLKFVLMQGDKILLFILAWYHMAPMHQLAELCIISKIIDLLSKSVFLKVEDTAFGIFTTDLSRES